MISAVPADAPARPQGPLEISPLIEALTIFWVAGTANTAKYQAVSSTPGTYKLTKTARTHRCAGNQELEGDRADGVDIDDRHFPDAQADQGLQDSRAKSADAEQQHPRPLRRPVKRRARAADPGEQRGRSGSCRNQAAGGCLPG